MLLPLTAVAQVYRSVDAEGRAVYTDRPVENSTKLDLPLVGGVEPVEGPTAGLGWPEDAGFRGSYSEFSIVSPEDNAIVTNADGEIRLSLLLTPPLQPGHRLRVGVDGIDAVGDLGRQMQVRLKGLAPGSHRIQAQVSDDAGTSVAATPLIDVHVRPTPTNDGTSR
ncbi:MAG: DUF4124 domain-containing protein [Thiohalocapsa sp.]